MPGSLGGRATLLCPGAWLGRPLGLQACTAQGRAAGSQPGPPSCPPATMLSPRTRPRHSSLITTLIFSAPLSPRFSLERKHPAVAQALVTVQRGDTTCPFSKTCDFTARAGPRGGGWGLGAALCWGTWPAPPRPRARSRGHSSSRGQRAASGGPHYLERRGLGGHVSGRSTRLLHAAGQCRWPRGSLPDTQEHCTLPGGRRRPRDPRGAWLTYIR